MPPVTPTVNILLSTFNGDEFIDQQIESLLKQTSVAITITIRDDGSRSEFQQTLKRYRDKHSCIQLTLAENKGLPDSFFQLMSDCDKSHHYYAFCDQDDIWPENKLAQAIEALEKTPHPIALYCSRQTYISDSGSIIGESFTPSKPLGLKNAAFENIAVGCTCVFTPALLAAATPQSNEIPSIIMHDWWIYLIATACGRVIFDIEPSTYYRQHNNNVIGGNISGWSKFRVRVRKYFQLKAKNKGGPIKQLEMLSASLIELEHTNTNNEIAQILNAYNAPPLKRIVSSRNSEIFYRQTTIDHIIWKILFSLKML